VEEEKSSRGGKEKRDAGEVIPSRNRSGGGQRGYLVIESREKEVWVQGGGRTLRKKLGPPLKSGSIHPDERRRLTAAKGVDYVSARRGRRSPTFISFTTERRKGIVQEGREVKDRGVGRVTVYPPKIPDDITARLW